MKNYSIGVIAKLTGLTVHNLRVWEKRHSAIETIRSESGRRIYNENSLERIRLLKSCVDNGFSIGSIASLDNDELKDLLEDFSKPTNSKSSNRGYTIWIAGSEALRISEKIPELPFDVEKTVRFDDVDQLVSRGKSEQPDILFMEQASMSADDTKKMAKLLRNINAKHILLLYRYARQQDLSYLKTIGVNTLKLPTDQSTIYDLLSLITSAPQGNPMMAPLKKAPRRHFSDSALNKAASISSSIDCECPHHLSELIKSLVSFENYSSECQNKDLDSAELHHHVHLRTSQARSILEELLETVLNQEGIDLSRVSC